MSRLAKYLLNIAVLAVCLGAGLELGPVARTAYERLFPEPAYVIGDFSALHAETGKPVVIFTTSTCPHCQRTREFLTKERIDFQEFVTDKSADAEQRFEALGGTAVPLLLIGDRRIVGFREDIIRASLAASRQAAN